MPALTFLSFLNDDGRCYAFDSRGEGYGRGEGAGIVVLKRLDDALRAGDNVRGVIRGSGVGQDGKTSGITLPSRTAQQSLIKSVYQSAGISNLHDTTYFEAHGTGTRAGDVTELGAIGDAFCDGDNSEQDSPLYVGSIKANIGHLESSSVGGSVAKATSTSSTLNIYLGNCWIHQSSLSGRKGADTANPISAPERGHDIKKLEHTGRLASIILPCRRTISNGKPTI